MRALLLLLPAVAAAEPATPVVTKAFVRDIAAGKVKPAELIDPATGVLQVVYIAGEYDPPESKFARRLCGRAAERELAHVIRRHMKMAVELDEMFTCKNRPRPTCHVGIAGEFSSTNEYVFRPTPDGKLVLDTLISTNSANKPIDEARVVARLRAKHIGGSCPSP